MKRTKKKDSVDEKQVMRDVLNQIVEDIEMVNDLPHIEPSPMSEMQVTEIVEPAMNFYWRDVESNKLFRGVIRVTGIFEIDEGGSK